METPFVVPASWCGDVVGVLMDEADALALPGRLSIGSHGYPQVCPPGTGQVVPLHRYLLGLRTGDGLIGDHINRTPLDNRRANLRTLTPSESNLNRAPCDNPMRGVYVARSGRFIAKLKWRRRQHFLGTFDTPIQAQAAVAAFVAEHHPTAA